jgi:gliding motility-associated lipoprotein GldH
MKYCYITVILLFLFSCDSNRVFEENVSIEKNVWELNQIPSFEYHNADTVSKVNILVNVRHSSSYPFSNLWVFVSTSLPNGTIKKDTLECVLAEKNGKWLGSGLGGIWDIQCQLKTVQLGEDGLYTFNIEQAMRHGDLAKIEMLPGIMEIGLRIEKQD